MIADIWVAFFHSPQQSLCGQAAAFLEAILRRQPGLQLERWTRLPYVALHNGDARFVAARLANPKSHYRRYVSSGDHVRTHYTLDMAVLALRLPGGPSHPRPPPPPPPRKRQQSQRRTIPAECEKKRGGDSIYAFLAGALTDDGLDASWGEVLDAGAGLSSMCWLAHRESRSYARRFAGAADPLTELCAAGVFREL